MVGDGRSAEPKHGHLLEAEVGPANLPPYTHRMQRMSPVLTRLSRQRRLADEDEELPDLIIEEGEQEQHSDG